MESRSSFKSESLGLDLTGTGQSTAAAAGFAMGTDREEHVNYMLNLSDLENEVSVTVQYRPFCIHLYHDQSKHFKTCFIMFIYSLV